MFNRLHVFLILFLLVCLLNNCTTSGSYPTDEPTVAEGKKLFMRNCASCHTLNNDGIGPRLGGITNLLSEKQLTDFIQHADQVIASGDARSVSQQKRYKLIMPPFEWLKEEEIKTILAYIDHETDVHQIAPMEIVMEDTTDHHLMRRPLPPVTRSGFSLELEDFIQLPRPTDAPADKGLSTLRSSPYGDGTIFVSDQSGIIYRINKGKATVFLDIRGYEDFVDEPGIASGLGSFDFHPDFLKNGLFYITHTEANHGQLADFTILDTVKTEIQWVVSELKMKNVSDAVFNGTRRELLRVLPPTFGHGMQDIGFVPGVDKMNSDYGLLYIGYGDGGANNLKKPQLCHHLGSFLGTILRIDPLGNNSHNGKYGIPADNPFVNEPDPSVVKEIYAYGFRNPHRMAWDEGKMFVADIGESNIEELNIVEKGGDYGWSNQEGNYGIFTKKDPKVVYELKESDRHLFKAPFAQYDHEDGNAISGGFVYRGAIAEMKAKYFFGDIVNGKLFFVNVDPLFSDSTVYELGVNYHGNETNMRELSQQRRLHLRISYDQVAGDLFVITKVDGWIRKVKGLKPTRIVQ